MPEVLYFESVALEMLFGFIALQNPALFQVHPGDLAPYRKVKESDALLLENNIPEEDVEVAETLIPEIIQENLDVRRPLNAALEVHDKLANLFGLLHKAWLRDGNLLWEKNQIRYKEWWNKAALQTKDDVLSLIRKYQNSLTPSHEQMIEDAKRIYITPSIYLYPQLGYNFIGDSLYILVGLPPISMTTAIISDSIAARCFAALGEENRLKILKTLVKDRSAQGIDLAKRLDISPATVSHHLKILSQSGLVSREREGKTTRYIPVTSRIESLSGYLKNLKEEA